MSSTSTPELGFEPSGRAPATWTLVGLLVVAHISTALVWARAAGETVPWALFLDRSARLRAMVGGQYAPLIEAEPWRLVRSVGLHADAGHLLVNGIALVVLGRMLEPWIGGARLLWWFGLAGVGGSIASHLAGRLHSDGASGGAFGLLGALVVLGFRHRDRLHPDDRGIALRWLPGFLVLNLLLSAVLPFVDGIGHLGGLAVGVALGGFARPEPPRPIVQLAEATGAAGLLAIAVFGPYWTG